METLQSWIKRHRGINVLAFEANYAKSSGFGDNEIVCGFCLASHFFDESEPYICRFCRAPIRETKIISELPEVTNRVYTISREHGTGNITTRPFLVKP